MKNSLEIFVLTSMTLLVATILILIAFPNPIEAKISYCASGDGIFQCFIKENDCMAFSESHNGTTCFRSKT